MERNVDNDNFIIVEVEFDYPTIEGMIYHGTKIKVSKSEFNDPYMGGKEIIVKRSDQSDIAVALLSEVTADGDEWAIYREH